MRLIKMHHGAWYWEEDVVDSSPDRWCVSEEYWAFFDTLRGLGLL